MKREHIRTWKDRGFRVEVYDTFMTHIVTCRRVVEYELYDDQFDRKTPIIGPVKMTVPLYCEIDGDEVIAFALGWSREDFPVAVGRLRIWLETGRIDQIEELHLLLVDGAEYWKDYHQRHDET